AVLAAVLDEPEDPQAAAVLERVQRHLRWQVRADLRPAGELDRGRLAVAQDPLEKVAHLRALCRVDLRNRCSEQLFVGVAEHRAAGRVGGEYAIGGWVDD